MTKQERFRGMMLGTAVGDALGLPAEGLARNRVKRMVKIPLRHRFVFGRGMISDDTEHTVFVAQSLLKHPDSPESFGRRLGWCMRLWFALLPAGIGLATARAILKLWLGFSIHKSGVFSAGNGPAMRICPVGAFFADAPEDLENYVNISTMLTHNDPKAVIATKAVAQVAAWTVREDLTQRPDADKFIQLLRAVSDSEEWHALVAKIENGIYHDLSTEAFTESLGLAGGVTGYIYHTVPVCLYAWYHHFGDFASTITAIIQCGGDTDTTAAIAGALAGIVTGEAGIPHGWIDGIIEWPRSVTVLRRIADQLAVQATTDRKVNPVAYFWPGLILRNVLFLIIVLTHGFRRLFPPYN